MKYNKDCEYYIMNLYDFGFTIDRASYCTKKKDWLFKRNNDCNGCEYYKSTAAPSAAKDGE